MSTRQKIVAVGCEVAVTIEGETATYVVGRQYGGSEENGAVRISTESPLGRALLGKEAGDDFTYINPAGTRCGHIESIS